MVRRSRAASSLAATPAASLPLIGCRLGFGPRPELWVGSDRRSLVTNVGEARQDRINLTMPISWRGLLAQYAGRLHRLHPAKRNVVIYDYVE